MAGGWHVWSAGKCGMEIGIALEWIGKITTIYLGIFVLGCSIFYYIDLLSIN